MADLRVLAAKTIIDGAFTYARHWIAAGAIRPRPVGETAIPSPAGAAPDAGCPVCRVHLYVGEAYLLLERLARRSEEGAIPPGLGGTIPLARRRLVDAQDLLLTVGAADANLRLQALTVHGQLAELVPALEGEVRPEDLPALAEDARRASEVCYDLAHAAFTLAEGAGGTGADAVYGILNRLHQRAIEPDQAVRELRRALETEAVGG